MFELLSTFNILSLLLGLLLLVLYVLMKNEPTNLPPGPRGMPIFGSLFTLANASHPSRLLRDMGKKYGPIMRVKLGYRMGIVLNGYDVIKEALVDKADYFSNRPVLPVLSDGRRDNGIVFTSQWRDRRRLALTSMRDFGLGKKSLEESMYEEARMLVQELETMSGQAVNLHDLMPVVTTNIICSIIRGERFPYGSETIKNMVVCFKAVIGKIEFGNTENYVPWVKHIPFMKMKTFQGARNEYFLRIVRLIQSWVDEHLESFDNEDIRDLIDLFISESRKDGSNCKAENIVPMVFDLFAAGTETTSTTLLWSIAYLIVHKDIQTKCRNEIYEIVGCDKLPDFSFMNALPYVNAVINEVQRIANIVPVSLLHATSSRVELRGYTIPKDCIVVANLESALKDEKYFGDPYTFRPERWLDAEGKLIRNQAQIPFSTGKRECLGKLLAKKELFIFLTSMLQNFEFEMEDGTKPPELGKDEGHIRLAPKYKAKIKKM